jgi:hypothetical protein
MCYTWGVQVSESSLADVDDGPVGRAVWGRRLFLTALFLFVVAGLAGFLGVHTSSKTTSEGDYELTLEYAGIARAGLDVPWQVTVTHEGGFDKELTLAVTGDYFDIFESQGFAPDPSGATRDAHTLYLTFDAPAGDVFTVGYDAYIQPSSQRGRDGSVSVLGPDGQPMATVDFDTWLWP